MDTYSTREKAMELANLWNESALFNSVPLVFIAEVAYGSHTVAVYAINHGADPVHEFKCYARGMWSAKEHSEALAKLNAAMAEPVKTIKMIQIVEAGEACH